MEGYDKAMRQEGLPIASRREHPDVVDGLTVQLNARTGPRGRVAHDEALHRLADAGWERPPPLKDDVGPTVGLSAHGHG
jgi:hypothetical protein